MRLALKRQSGIKVSGTFFLRSLEKRLVRSLIPRKVGWPKDSPRKP